MATRDPAGCSSKIDLFPALGLWAGLLTAVWAGSAASQGPTTEDIWRECRGRLALNLRGARAEVRLVSSTPAGVSKEQRVETSAIEVGGENRSLTRFLSPPSVVGVSVLTMESKGQRGQVLLYLPKLKRVRQVAGDQAGEPFMHTDFSYADLGSAAGLGDGRVTRLPEQELDGRRVYRLKAEPQGGSPYRTVEVWVEPETFIPLRIDYADREGKPWKVYRSLKRMVYAGRPITSLATMENLQTGSKTTLEVLKVEPSRLGPEAYTERGLERG